MSSSHTKDSIECDLKDSFEFPEAVTIARQGGFALLQHFSEVRAIQLNRQIDREKRWDKKHRLSEFEQKLQYEESLQEFAAAQTAREGVRPPKASKDKAILHGRVINNKGVGVKNLRVTLCGANEAALGSKVTNKSGYFKIKTDPQEDMSLVV